jgi:hypothetical protein
MCYEQRFFRLWFTKLTHERERQTDVPEQNPQFESMADRVLLSKPPHWNEAWSEQKRHRRHEPEEVI